MSDFTLNVPICTIKQFCRDNPQFTEKQIRWMVFRSADNGMDEFGVVVRHPAYQRAMLIDADAFESWWTSTRPVKPRRRNFFGIALETNRAPAGTGARK